MRRKSTRAGGGNPEAQPPVERMEDSGRHIVLFRRDAVKEGVRILEESASLRVASTADSQEGVLSSDDWNAADAVVLDKLGIAVVRADPEQVSMLEVDPEGPICWTRPERTLYALADLIRGASAAEAGSVSVSRAFLRNYHAAFDYLFDAFTGEHPAEFESEQVLAETEVTWGLQATRAAASAFTGRGVRVAVLDTGLDLTHPDFRGRRVVSQSFIPGVTSVQDGHGHGTHCAGTVGGPARPSALPRYGVAPGVELYVGKVLTDRGSGQEGWILGGINWAITNQCRVISMSLGRPVQINEPPDPDYESMGRRALDQGSLIVAAAGNESQRPTSIAPVGAPANSQSILAVAAIDSAGRVGWFSCGGLNPGGGQVDVCAPGVQVYSSWSTTAPRPAAGTRYHTIDGTSMAAPHVAGIAALWGERYPTATPYQLWTLLMQNARRLPLPATDVGAGLVQAP